MDKIFASFVMVGLAAGCLLVAYGFLNHAGSIADWFVTLAGAAETTAGSVIRYTVYSIVYPIGVCAVIAGSELFSEARK